jgi:hypothetical protein
MIKYHFLVFSEYFDVFNTNLLLHNGHFLANAFTSTKGRKEIIVYVYILYISFSQVNTPLTETAGDLTTFMTNCNCT